MADFRSGPIKAKKGMAAHSLALLPVSRSLARQVHMDQRPPLLAFRKANVTVGQCKQSVILAHADVGAGIDLCAPLAQDNIA